MEDIYTKVLDSTYKPTAKEFNRLIDEHVEYKKLLELKKDLKWFGTSIGGIDITTLQAYIDSKLKDVPESVKIFNTLSHGQNKIKVKNDTN